MLKEAYVKMLGEGLQMDFRKISCGEILANNSVEDKSNADYICFVIS